MLRSLLRCLVPAAVLLLASTSISQAAINIVNCVAGPFFTIQAAVTAAVNGDTIVVEVCPAGPYNENVLIVGFTGLHLVGASEGDAGAVRAGVGANTLNPPVVVSGAGLAGPCFDIQTSDDIKVQNFRITNCSLAGVRFRSSNQVLVLANRIINIPDASGVEAISGTDAQVSSNLIALTGVNGVLLDSTETSTIADNFIVRSGREGILTNGANNSRIDNNDIRQSGLEPVEIQIPLSQAL